MTGHKIAKRQTSTGTEKFTDCGGTLTGATGHFYTPYFPYTYPNNSDCVWTIEVRNYYGSISSSPFFDGLLISHPFDYS